MSKLSEYAENENTQWVAQGLMHGYPECCIEEFIDKRVINRDYSVVLEGNHSGFIPCKTHSKAIIDGKVKLEDLIQDYRYKGLPKFKPFT